MVDMVVREWAFIHLFIYSYCRGFEMIERNKE